MSFYPFTENPSGEVCTAYAAAYMSLDPQVGDEKYAYLFIVVCSTFCGKMAGVLETGSSALGSGHRFVNLLGQFFFREVSHPFLPASLNRYHQPENCQGNLVNR